MQYFIHRQLYAIHRGAGTLPGFHSLEEVVHGMQTQGITNGNGMAHAGLGFIRGYHYYFSQAFYGFQGCGGDYQPFENWNKIC